jgi:coatomer subunit beta'
MPLRLDIKKKLSARSDRVKCVDFHPTEPWTLSALYSGNIFIWDYNTQTLVKQLEVCNLPVRCAKFVPRKQWIVTASDDMQLRVFNYNTLEKVHELEAHTDYIRYIAVHPSMPYVLSSSDDMSIKLWDWDKNWACNQVFEGHAHYVMMTQWNPKDATIFASCSLDRSIKVWGITGGNSNAHFTLNGHQKGVNCVDYAPTGEKPYLISGSDDKTVKIWDYQTKQCIQTLESHTNNVSSALFHPILPIILTGSEDGTVRIWHAATYRLETTLNYLLERVWSISVMKGSNSAAFGYDEGTVVIKLGSEEPVASMHNGKIIWAKGNEIQRANLKLVDEGTAPGDGERVALSVQDMGAAEIFPQYVAHHPSGRLFAVCGDGEYVIYTAQALRNKSFGPAQEFVWGTAGDYATRDASGKITVFKDFKENFSFKPPFTAEEIFGGHLIAVKSSDFVCFYDWNEYRLVRRIDVVPKEIIWSEESDGGCQVVLACADNFYILRHDKEAVVATLAAGVPIDEDGIEAAFDLSSEVSDKVVSGTWVSDCFVYVNASQRLLCLVAGSTETIAHLDRAQYLLGYIPEQSKLYLVDKELNVTPYTLHLALVEYQSAIMRKDFDTATANFEKLPESLHNRVARFLENQGYALEALGISKDDDHCFELATTLGRLEQAADFIRKICAQGNPARPPRGKWKQLGDVALEQGNFELARSCFHEAKDFGAQFLVHTACGDAMELRKTALLAKEAGVSNIAVLCFLLLGDLEEALQVLIVANRLPEAAFFARCYCPSQLPEVVKLWKTDLSGVNAAVAESLADPKHSPTLFPEHQLSVAAEEIFRKRLETPCPASQYAEQKAFQDELNVMEKIKELQPAGFRQFLLRGAGAAPVSPVAATPPAPVAVAPAEPVVTAPTSPVAAVAPVVQPAVETIVPPVEQVAPEVVEAAPAPGPELTEATAPEAAVPEATQPPQADLLDLL